MIVFDNVSLKYHYDEYPLLTNLSFTLKQGVNTVLCDTQSGKTSFCKLLVKDVKPTSGQIFVDGAPISSITNAHLGILYLPSNPTFFANRSVQYNIAYPLKVRKIAKTERQNRVAEVAAKLGISCLKLKAKKLNQAQKSSVALARGLTVERKVVLFDDYFDNNIDVDSVLQLFDGVTCVIITSDVNFARGNVVVLDGGMVVYQGDVDGAKQAVSTLDWLSNRDLSM